MRYKIPRYIDYEARIFGPANFKQFIFLLGGMITIGLLWVITDTLFVFFLLSFIVAAITIALAFGKINGQPMIIMIGKFISFRLSGSKTYFWKKKEIQPKVIQRKEIQEEKDSDQREVPISKGRGKLDHISKKIETS